MTQHASAADKNDDAPRDTSDDPSIIGDLEMECRTGGFVPQPFMGKKAPRQICGYCRYCLPTVKGETTTFRCALENQLGR